MSMKKRRTLLDLPFTLGLWLAPPRIGIPVLGVA
jgi:hypothetical protein